MFLLLITAMKVSNILKNTLTIFTLGIAAASCSDDNKADEWWWGDVSEEEITEKPRYIWIDAAANFPRFCDSKENIAEDLQKAYNAGITDVIVDVRPTMGDVLFKTSAVDQVKELANWQGGVYHFHQRTATWDYLQAFIDAGHSIGLRVHAAINTFTAGHRHTNDIGDRGLAFRDPSKKDWFTVLSLDGKLVNSVDCMEDSYRTKFLNPANDEVQDFLITLLTDLAKYDVDGIFLDRCRYNDWASDFSEVSVKKFQEYIGGSISCNYSMIPETYKKQWIAFRAKTIHDFIVKAGDAIHGVNPAIQFGVYVGAWYSTYYECGVNWASPKYNAAAQYSTWASAEWNRYGYADHIDYLLLGAYAAADKLYGTTEWTCQGFCSLAREKLRGAVRFAGGPDVGNGTGWTAGDRPDAVTNSIDACLSVADGYFIFDMCHIRSFDYWDAIKAGVDNYKKTLEEK